MQDWSDGYMTEVAYTYGYYSEHKPQRARLALLASCHPTSARPANSVSARA